MEGRNPHIYIGNFNSFFGFFWFTCSACPHLMFIATKRIYFFPCFLSIDDSPIVSFLLFWLTRLMHRSWITSCRYAAVMHRRQNAANARHFIPLHHISPKTPSSFESSSFEPTGHRQLCIIVAPPVFLVPAIFVSTTLPCWIFPLHGEVLMPAARRVFFPVLVYVVFFAPRCFVPPAQRAHRVNLTFGWHVLCSSEAQAEDGRM